MTKVEIANIALMRLGQKRITSFDDPSEQARAVKALYDTVRDELLRSHPFNFAIERSSLAQLEDTPTFGYSYAYQLPSDCLRVLEVYDDDDWKVEGRKILTNESSCYIRYIKRIEDPNQYDSAFIKALALKLAIELAQPLVGSTSLTKQLWDEFVIVYELAKSVDGQEGTLEIAFDSSWVNARAT